MSLIYFIFCMTRRDFIKVGTASGVILSVPKVFFFNKSRVYNQNKTWAFLIHLSVNMWKNYYSELQFSESLWNEALNKMVESGITTVVIDLGDGVRYESHPEIAVRGAWTTEKLSKEIAKIRRMGLEPIPKLNFSTCHDEWLGRYGKAVSSEEYYKVCKNLIKEVSFLFNKPRFFHLGMDEETQEEQKEYDLIVIRQGAQYWGDMYFLLGEVLKNGARPWIWQDYVRTSAEELSKMMPRYVVQSNWYNRNNFDPETNISIKAYQLLESLGYDQIPGGSNYYEGTDTNILNNVKFCTENISDERLMGFIQSSWRFTTNENRSAILKAIELMGEAKLWYEKNKR